MARIVLVADDSPTIQKRAMGILKGEGFEVETVSNGVAAIKRLAALHPVVILADVSMPGRDGYEVCEFVKTSPELSLVPVLLVASDMEPYDQARSEEVRADGIIKKPFEANELISIVERFAEQFEAATLAIPMAPVAPPAKREITQELAVFGQEPDDAPTVAQHVEPGFTALAGEIAFTDPPDEQAPGFSHEPPPAGTWVTLTAPQADAAMFPESAFEPPSALAEEHLLAEEPSPIPGAPSPPAPPPELTPSFQEGLETTTPEPVFLEEQSAPPAEPARRPFEGRTMIFRAPVEIADPVWKDETVISPSTPESDTPMTLEPQPEAEAPVASPETTMEQPLEPPHDSPAVTATSLDSFSLDDAAGGEVHIASGEAEAAPAEVVYSAPAEEIPAVEIASPEPAPEMVYSEFPSPERAPEVVYAETAASEGTPETVPPEIASPAPAPEMVPTETTPPPTAPEADLSEIVPPAPEWVSTEAVPSVAAPEAVRSEVAPPAPGPEMVSTETSPLPEQAPEVVYSETAPSEATPEAVATEITPPAPMPELVATETTPPSAAPEAVLAEAAPPAPEWISGDAVPPAAAPEMVSAETTPPPPAPEAVLTEFAPPAPAPELVSAETTPPQDVPEGLDTEGPALEAVPQAPPEPEAEVAAPPREFNWDLFYFVVRKVVVRMSPPILPADLVEEIARRIADEIATEINSESPQPPT